MSIDLNELEIVSDYFDNEKLRKSFNALAMKTFGLDFEKFYKEKLYFKRYKAFSIVKDGAIIANVSINLFNLVVGKMIKKAVQLGTVMTDEAYRGNGLSKILMEHVISIYQNTTDIIFLYANNTVLNFYPKFGFERVIETYYELESNKVISNRADSRRLNPLNREDAFLISNLLKARSPVSNMTGVTNDRWPMLVYINSGEYDCDYFIDSDILVIGKCEERKYHIYDIVSKKKVEINDVIEKLNLDDVDIIKFYFPVKSYKYDFVGVQNLDDNEVLFVLSKEPLKIDLTFSPLEHT